MSQALYLAKMPFASGYAAAPLAISNLKNVLLAGLVFRLKASTGRHGKGTFTSVTAGLVSASSQTFTQYFFLLLSLRATLGVHMTGKEVCLSN